MIDKKATKPVCDLLPLSQEEVIALREHVRLNGVLDPAAVQYTVPVSSIEVGHRHRRDLGDLQSLADTIAQVGLLHPVVLDSHNRLIAGLRRLEAVKLLGWEEVQATVVNLDRIAAICLNGEAGQTRDILVCFAGVTSSTRSTTGLI